MKFPEITKPETLERRYLGKLSKKALNFIKSILKMDPAERLTVNDALNHPFLEGLSSEFEINNNNNNFNPGTAGNAPNLIVDEVTSNNNNTNNNTNNNN